MTTTPTPTSHAERLIEVLRARHQALHALEAMATVQERLVTERDGDALAALVHDRRGAVDAIRAGDHELEEAIAACAALEFDAPQRAMIRDLLESLSTRIAAVGDLDRRTAEVLRSRREAIARELASAGAVERARGAYAGGAAKAERSPRFADRKA